jgi:uncharacterized protein (TIGR00730 family)
MTSTQPNLNSVHETLTEDQFLLLSQLQDEYKKGMLSLNFLGEHTVTFYGGSRVEVGSPTYKAIAEIAEGFGKQNWGVVTGGGPGVMSAALEGVRKGGGKAISFMINIAGEPPFAKPDVCQLFNHFSARKYCLRQSDVLIYAPGGIGTLDELMENLTLINTGKSPIKPIFLFDSKFWKPYTDWFQTLVFEEKLANENFLELFKVVDSSQEVFDYLGF